MNRRKRPADLPPLPQKSGVRTRRVSRRKRRTELFLYGPIVLFLVLGFFAWFTHREEPGTWMVKAGDKTTNFEYLSRARAALSQSGDTAWIEDGEGNVVDMNQGIARLNVYAPSVNTQGTIENTDTSSYYNGASAPDALFIRSSDDGRQYLIELSGVRMWIDQEDAVLDPRPDAAASSWTVQDGALIHMVLENDGSYASYAVGPAPDALEENQAYFSWDGNWFYDDFDKLSADARANTHRQAVNSEAYYNPYQYLNMFSDFGISAEQVNAFLEANDHADDSVLYDNYDLFTQVQAETGVNAALMLSQALNESGYGTSEYATKRSNLFGHAAYDDNPDAASSYDTLEEGIADHAKSYMLESYGRLGSDHFHGAFAGNKAAGINVDYASDPWWGEKSASFLWRLDTDHALLSRSLWIGPAPGNVQVYNRPDGTVLGTFSAGELLSLEILGEEEHGGQTWYAVQPFFTLNGQLPETMYIPKNQLS